MTQPKLVQDKNSHGIQVAELADDAVAIAVGAASSADVIPSGAKIIRVGIDTDCWIKFGTSGVTVTSTNGHYFPAGVEFFVVPDGATHLANIQHTSSGNGTMCSVAGSVEE